MTGIQNAARLHLAVLAVLAFATVCQQKIASAQLDAPPNAGEIRWTDNLDAALQNAQSTDRPILVHFYGDNCPPCRLLERKTFHDKGLINTIHANVIPVRINAERERKIADRYAVTRWPTDVYLLPNGEVIDRGVCNSDPTVYGRTIERIALRHRDWSVQRQASQKYQQRKQDSAIADGSRARREQHTVGAPIVSVPSKSVSSSSQWNRPDPQSFAATSNVRQIANPFASDIDPALEAPEVHSYADVSFNTVPINAPPTYAAPINAAPTIVQISSDTDRTSESARINTVKRTKPVSPAIPLLTEHPGLDGFCPVTLRRSILAACQGQPATNPWVAGSNDFSVRHRGRIYLCASEEARRELLTNPDLLAPILSGCDLIEFLRSGNLFEGKCEFGFVDQKTGRVYLFCNKNNWIEFSRNCEAYARIIDEQNAERVAQDPNSNVQR